MRLSKPKASFVIPVYNGAAFIAEAIDSCLKQTENRIEIVVVNDGSTDTTQRIVDYYAGKDPRVVSVRLEKNAGRSEARNVGIERAEGEVILVLDADDRASEFRVKETLKFFKKNPGYDLLHGSFLVMDTFNNVLGKVDAQSFDEEKLKETKFTYIGHSTLAFRKKVFETVKYSPGDYCRNAIDDWKFIVDAWKAGFKIGAISPVLSSYRFIPKDRDEKKILELKEAVLA